MKRDIPNIKLLGVFPGQLAPDFHATTLDGKDLTLSDLRGKVVLIDFWATWCGPCVAELPNVKKAWEKYGEKGFVVVSISFDKRADTARAFAEKQGMKWPQVWVDNADKSDLAKLYNVSGIPATFLIGRDGKVAGVDLRGDALLTAVAKAVKEEVKKDESAALNGGSRPVVEADAESP